MNLKEANECLDERVCLSSPTMHDLEIKYINTAFDTNWVTTVGENINEVERISAEKTGMNYAVGLSCCTAALHLCVKLAGEKIYGKPRIGQGAVAGKRVFCSDMTFVATLNPVVYEGGTPVFIDTEKNSWNMDPVALEKAFELYPDTKIVIYSELYGFPGRNSEIERICKEHGAILIEDAAEALGATVNGRPCGSFGDYGCVSFNGNKIITGSSGGCLMTSCKDEADKARKWSTQAREKTVWYQHEEVGYNYRMSNIVAGIVRGQFPHIEEHIRLKKAIYDRYKSGFAGLPVTMNPIIDGVEPNYWLSALVVNEDAMCRQYRDEYEAKYIPEHGKTCPTEILEALERINAEGRPFWKPMHMQPVYKNNDFIGRQGSIKHEKNGQTASGITDVGADIFNRGCCLPSDIKMTAEQQDKIIKTVRACFD